MNRSLQLMLDELESHQLQVILVPLNPQRRGWNEGGMKRVVADQPPAWYRLFCRDHVSSRGIRRGKFDTKIKRANVLRALGQMVRNVPAGKYEDQLRQIARQRRRAA